jgi:hypothetical protein
MAMRDWKYLTPNEVPLTLPFLRSAVERGQLNYGFNLVEHMSWGLPKILYRLEDDILSVARHTTIIHNRVFKLLFPPIHLFGDEAKEVSLIHEYLREGITARVPKEYAIRNSLEYAPESEYSGAREVVYSRDNLDLSGQKHANSRYYLKNLKKYISSGELEVVLDAPLSHLEPLYQTWVKQQEYGEGIYPFLKEYEATLSPLLRNYCLKKGADFIYCSVFLPLTEDSWVSPCAMTDYSRDPVGGLQRLSKFLVFEAFQKLQTLNEGGYSDKTVKFSKTKIPHRLVTQVRLVSPKKLSKEEWQAFKPAEPSINFFNI